MDANPKDPIVRLGWLEAEVARLSDLMRKLEAHLDEGKVPHQDAILKALLFEALTVEELASNLGLDKEAIGDSLVALVQRGIVTRDLAGKLSCYPSEPTRDNLESSILMALTLKTHDLDSLASLLHCDDDVPGFAAKLDELVTRGSIDMQFCGEAGDYLYSRGRPRYVDVPWDHFRAMLKTGKLKEPEHLRMLLVEAGITAEFLEPPA